MFEGYVYSDGPAADAIGNVYFAEVTWNHLYKVDSSGVITLEDEDTAMTMGRAWARIVAGMGVADSMAKHVRGVSQRKRQSTVICARLRDALATAECLASPSRSPAHATRTVTRRRAAVTRRRAARKTRDVAVNTPNCSLFVPT